VAEIESRFVDTADLRVHALVAGEGGGGDPVVFLHGFPQTSHEWRHQLDGLAAAGHPCYAPDNRGFGGTDKPGTRITRDLLGGDVIRFLDALSLERVVLVGHDWGGIIAFKAAIDHPDRVGRLALLDTLCTVWSPRAVHGYWFKAEPRPEEFFAAHARDFIEVLFGGADGARLGDRPASPWPFPRGERARPAWVDEAALAHYVEAFADPAAHAAAIQYYRYALPFHRVVPDDEATHGERFESLGERAVAEMWSHPDGLEQHPGFADFYDYGPEDRHKRFSAPTLWMYGGYLGASGKVPANGDPSVPSGNPFVDQFSRYFPDLRVRAVACGHFIPEEAPDYTKGVLLDFIAGRI